MTRLALALLVAFIAPLLAATDTGNARAPKQAELHALLAGNTLTGEWDGRPFTQHFNVNGTTRYREGDGETTHGTWRVIDSGQYCSIWPPFQRETCYDVLVDGKRVYWKWQDRIHPSEVSEGDQF